MSTSIGPVGPPLTIWAIASSADSSTEAAIEGVCLPSSLTVTKPSVSSLKAAAPALAVAAPVSSPSTATPSLESSGGTTTTSFPASAAVSATNSPTARGRTMTVLTRSFDFCRNPAWYTLLAAITRFKTRFRSVVGRTSWKTPAQSIGVSLFLARYTIRRSSPACIVTAPGSPPSMMESRSANHSGVEMSAFPASAEGGSSATATVATAFVGRGFLSTTFLTS
mmetsp:Transcript_26079/g.68444  ORF Transcript_26079/g.68444 Transcript_26079/m.68444 type:complete len:223 (-) Transcript_26079:712-1380(-)